MEIPIIIKLAIIVLHIALGVDYIRVLKNHWPFFRLITENRLIASLFSILIWELIFLIYITHRTFEPLTRSRRNDFPETSKTIQENK